VCRDTLYADLNGQPPPQFFIPYAQQTQIRRLSTRSARRQSETIFSGAPRYTRRSELPLVNVRTQRQQNRLRMQDERLFVTLTSVFGHVALVLASVGIYGVVAIRSRAAPRESASSRAGRPPAPGARDVLREAFVLSARGSPRSGRIIL